MAPDEIAAALRGYLAARATWRPDLSTLTVEDARAVSRKEESLDGPPEAVASVHDVTVARRPAPLRARVYRPDLAGPLPVLVWSHGGGFVLGDLDSSETICRRLANRGGCLVVSVDYRLAPEHPWPAALDDAWAALEWAARAAAEYGGDPGRIAVGGESAGGNLAAMAALRARDTWSGTTLKAQVLFCPVLGALTTTPSYERYAEGYGLSRAEMAWFLGHYLGPSWHDSSHEQRVSPTAGGRLTGLPPAHLVVAECDVLRDEQEAYASALADTGIPVRLARYPGMIHGFSQMSALAPAAGLAVEDAARFLARRLAPD